MSTMRLSCTALGLTDYETGLAWQQALVDRRLTGDAADSLLLLEHPPVFTLGRGADEKHLLRPGQVPVHRVGRGGEATFHGPGQLVAYPIVDLKQHGKDVHVYLRQLEEVVIAVLAEWRIEATRRAGCTGVWVADDNGVSDRSAFSKIASIGIGVRRWVTFHGFALNVTTDLTYFSKIVPCGLAGVRMTSMQRLLGRAVGLDAVGAAVGRCFAEVFGYQEMVWNTRPPQPACKPEPGEATMRMAAAGR